MTVELFTIRPNGTTWATFDGFNDAEEAIEHATKNTLSEWVVFVNKRMIARGCGANRLA